MFGYVRVYSPQLKVWENELYKSIYCGLCKYGGKRTTRLTRFFLNYDFVALAVVRMALNDEKPILEKHFCPYFPKKKNMVNNSPAIEFTADSFIILAYYKLLDDKKDTKGLKKILSHIPPGLLKKQAVLAESQRAEMGKFIKNELDSLDKEESENCSSIDKVADCFAVLMGKILSYDLEDSKKRISYEIGYHMGRYIYIIDALDDFKSDLKSCNYNVLVNIYGNMDNLKNNVNVIVDTLKASLLRVKNAFNLLENDVFSGIIDNILTYGADYTINKTLESSFRE